MPEMIWPFIPDIQDAHALASSEKIACFQEIYTRLFQAALASKPALVMIHNADLVDSCSLAALLRITEVDTQGLPERQHVDGPNACGGIILATCQPLPSSDPGEGGLGPRGLHGDISHVLLQPLQRVEIEQLAHQALGCSSVRGDLLDVLIGERIPPPPPPPPPAPGTHTRTHAHTVLAFELKPG